MRFLFYAITLLPLAYDRRSYNRFDIDISGFSGMLSRKIQGMKPHPHDISYWFWGEVAIVLLSYFLWNY